MSSEPRPGGSAELSQYGGREFRIHPLFGRRGGEYFVVSIAGSWAKGRKVPQAMTRIDEILRRALTLSGEAAEATFSAATTVAGKLVAPSSSAANRSRSRRARTSRHRLVAGQSSELCVQAAARRLR